MSSNRLAIAALALACIASAAAGGYLATRQNTVPTPAAAMTPTPTAPAETPTAAPATTPTGAPVAATVPERPVQETEAVVSEPAKKSTAAAKPTMASKRAELLAARQIGGVASATARRDQPPPLTST